MGGILSSMQGGNNKAFSLSSFTGSGLNEASVLHVLQDTKDALGGGFGIANMGGLGEILSKVASESQSPLAKILAAFNREDAFANWAEANKDAIAGKDSPDWGEHAENQRHRDQAAGHDDPNHHGAPFDPNNDVYKGVRDSEARNAEQHHDPQQHHQGQGPGEGDGHGGGHGGQGEHGHGGGQDEPGRGDDGGTGGRRYGEEESVQAGGFGHENDYLQYQHHAQNNQAYQPDNNVGTGGQPYGQAERTDPGGYGGDTSGAQYNTPVHRTPFDSDDDGDGDNSGGGSNNAHSVTEGAGLALAASGAIIEDFPPQALGTVSPRSTPGLGPQQGGVGRA
jgi:hypothetical protein